MCEECGCGQPKGFTVQKPGSMPAPHKHWDAKSEQWHEHEHHHGHAHHTHEEHSCCCHGEAGGRQDEGCCQSQGHQHEQACCCHDEEDGQAEGCCGGHGHSHHGAHQGCCCHDSSEAVHVREIEMNMPILEMNDRLAAWNRGFFAGKGVQAINFMSSPGAGKTTLLQASLKALSGKTKVAVLVGDLATDLDGLRLSGLDAQVLQITTGTACHLDARMIRESIEQLDLDGVKILLIENVGNLVCPAAFDLGEEARVVLFSTTEGEDKPLKYPPMFAKADVVLITKSDMATAAGFDEAKARESLKQICPTARVLTVSAKTGQGMEAWLECLTGHA